MAQAQRALDTGALTGSMAGIVQTVAQAQRALDTGALTGSMAGIVQTVAQAQRALDTGALTGSMAGIVQTVAQAQRALDTGALTTLAQAVAHISVSQGTLERLQAAASQSWMREMQAVSPLLRDHFQQPLVNLVDTSLHGFDDLVQDADDSETAPIDLPHETVNEIEEALSGFERAVQGLPPAMARRLWISWVQVVVFALCLQALILLPVTAEVMALMGSGALPVAQQAGLAAAKVWDKHHPSTDSDSSDEE
ncbi:hypothetical protein GCM10023335_38920 [Streptomyces siamensis]|uniref:Uncharacterized protein n=1 Tax=Streptomyces siamensis TaxID=1274986 RepID=A0ABP9IZ02_9ACTN